MVAAFIDMVVGVLFGSIAGLKGGKIEEIMMRIADIFHSLPRLLIIILLTVVLGQGISTIIIAITLTGWINMARIVRTQILSLKQEDFVTASLAMGASHLRVIITHLIPNIIGSIMTTVTLTIPIAIFTEAFLSFLGLGIQAPIASLGTMASDGLPALTFYPWRLFFPGIFITSIILCFNIIGNALKDSFDPRLQ